MRELGVLGNANYQVVCLMDHQSMVTVATEKYGVFDCKPLAVLWAKFPEQYTEENTVSPAGTCRCTCTCTCTCTCSCTLCL